MEQITLNLLILQLLTGLALGSMLVLMAIGLTLIFGLLTIVNFAHGALFAVGAFFGIWFYNLTNNFWLSLVVTPIVLGLLGALIERFLVRPLYGRGIDYPLLLTFGLAYVLVELLRIIFGTEGLPADVPTALASMTNLGFGYFPTYRLFVIVITAAVLVGLWYFIERTHYGLIVRAGARDPEIVRVLGIDIGKIWLLIFALGAGLAGLAGLLGAPIRGVIPEMGVPVLVEAFVVTVVGGMGSLVGAVVSGLLIGVVIAMTSLFAPDMAQVVMYILMALVLMWRPQGLFGRAGLMA